MAQRPLRPCKHPGCPALVRDGSYCPAHQRVADQHRAEAQRHYDQHQRDQRSAEFYHSPAWIATRQAVLARDHYLCQRCLEQGRITPADTVHHIVELQQDWSRRLDMTNLVSLCQACHNAVHGRRDRRRGGRGDTQGGSGNFSAAGS